MEVLVAIFCLVLGGGLALGLYQHQLSDQRRRDRAATYRLGGSDLAGLAKDGSKRREPPRLLSRQTHPAMRWAKDLIEQAGLELPPLALLSGLIILFTVGCVIAGRFFQAGLIPCVGAGLAIIPVFVLRTLRRRRLKTLGHQLPYVLDMLESALESGHTLLRGLQMAITNSPEPLAGELRAILDQVRVGVTLPLAIEALYRRVPVEELGFLASAVSVQAESGSSLAEILRHVTHSIRYRQRLEDQIRALTSQSRSSAMIVSALPGVVLGAFSLMRGDYARLLFTNPLGVKLLETAIVLDLLAFVLMRKIAQVDY